MNEQVSKKQQMRSDRRLAEFDDLIAETRYIITKNEALMVLSALEDEIAALDFETTGLDPTYAKVRLSCIYHPKTGIVLLDHMYCGTFEELSKCMLDTTWLVYNAKFETRWFDKYHPNQVNLVDIDFMAKVKRGGGPSSLAMMARRDLQIIMDKEEQLSDWSQPKLSVSQLDYAAKDALITYLLYEKWKPRLSNKQIDCVFMLQDAVRPTVECEQTGMVLDVDYHEQNIAKWRMKQQIALRRVRHWTPEAALKNPASNKQVSDLIKTQIGDTTLRVWPKTEKTHQLKLERKVIQPIIAKMPYPFSRWANALLRFRYYNKYLSTYGDTLVTKQHLEGRITYRLNIAQAATCRYSSSSINIQNIPRSPWVRRAFLPPLGYDWFAVADYSGIEVRILAEISGDEQLLEDAIYGDVHSASASAIYQLALDEFIEAIKDETHPHYLKFRELRSRAKNFTFQNVYGAMALALSVTLSCSVEEAEEALRKWAERYPKAYNYRHIIFEKMSRGGYLPVCDGREIFVYKAERRLPVAANYGVQGAAATVMYRAMHHVYQLREKESRRNLIGLCASVHDELILAALDGHEEHAKNLLTRGMVAGYLDVFPGADTHNLVEAKHGPTWGDAK